MKLDKGSVVEWEQVKDLRSFPSQGAEMLTRKCLADSKQSFGSEPSF